MSSISTLTFFLVLFFFFAPNLDASPLRGVARFVQSDQALVRNPAAVQGRRAPRSGNSGKIDVEAGESLDLFYRFGFFSLSVRVVPRNDPGTWIIREPMADIFRQDSLHQMTRLEPAPAFRPDFEVFFADDESELLQAYFSAFRAEGIEQPHKLYTGSWHSSTKAKYLGLDKEVFDGESGFVLVRLQKPRATVTAMGRKQLKPEVAAAAGAISVGDEKSVLDFVRRFGSHYIEEVVVGESVYQVYALKPDQYSMAKAAFLGNGNSRGGPGTFSAQQFGDFQRTYLAPFAVRQAGRVLAASGDRDTLEFLETRLADQGRFGSYPNLFKLASDPEAMGELEALTDSAEAVLSLKFTSLRMTVPDIQAREFYDGVIDTNALLWESNI